MFSDTVQLISDEEFDFWLINTYFPFLIVHFNAHKNLHKLFLLRFAVAGRFPFPVSAEYSLSHHPVAHLVFKWRLSKNI